MRVLRPFRAFLAVLSGLRDDLDRLTAAVVALVASQTDLAPAVERLEALERRQAQWEAENEGLLLKAEGKLRAANNAEARERALKRSYERIADPFAEEGVEPEAGARHPDSPDDASRGETDGVYPLRVDVAPSNKTLAQRAKFGVR